MKKIISLLFICVLLSFTAVMAFAETDTTELETEAVTESETAAEQETEAEVSGDVETETEAHPFTEEMSAGELAKNFFIRIWEWVVDNRLMLASVILDGVIIGILYLVKKSKSKMDDKIVSTLVDIKADAATASTETTKTDTNVTSAVNSLIDGYNEMSALYAAQEGLQDDRDKLVASVLETNMAILGILQTVYANNRNIPQGTKDLINYKYAKCLSTLESNEDLKAIAELVKKTVEVNTNDEQNEGKGN